MRAMIVACSLAAAACGAKQSATASSDKLRLDVDLFVIRNGVRTFVPPEGDVFSDETLELEVTPSQRAFLYVIQYHPDGTKTLLAPTVGHVSYAAGEKVLLPPADDPEELYFDATTGVETIVVMASPRPIDELDASASEEIVEARSTTEVAPVAIMDAGVAPVDAGVAIVVDAGVPPPDAKPKRPRKDPKPPKPKTIAVGGGEDPGGFGAGGGVRPRGVGKRRKDRKDQGLRLEADEAGVVIQGYVVIHR